MKYLIDTSWVIDYLRGKEEIVKILLSLEPEGLAISIITLAELYEGVFRSRDPISAENHLKDFLKRDHNFRDRRGDLQGVRKGKSKSSPDGNPHRRPRFIDRLNLSSA